MKNIGIYLMVTMFAAIVAAVVCVEPTAHGLVSGILLGAFYLFAVIVVTLAP